MTPLEVYKQASGGDSEAEIFLIRFDEYFDQVRSFIESKTQCSKKFVKLLAQTNVVYSMPFYVKNAQLLHLPVLQALRTNNGKELVMAVATLKLGFDKAKELNACIP